LIAHLFAFMTNLLNSLGFIILHGVLQRLTILDNASGSIFK